MVYKIHLGTGGFIFYEGRALIVRRDPSEGYLAGYYEMPGGGIELGEDPYIGIEREVLEETNLQTKALKPFHTWVDPYPHGQDQYYEIDFLMELQEGIENLKLSSEHDDLKWITNDELPDYKITEKVAAAIRLGFKEIAT